MVIRCSFRCLRGGDLTDADDGEGKELWESAYTGAAIFSHVECIERRSMPRMRGRWSHPGSIGKKVETGSGLVATGWAFGDVGRTPVPLHLTCRNKVLRQSLGVFLMNV